MHSGRDRVAQTSRLPAAAAGDAPGGGFHPTRCKTNWWIFSKASVASSVRGSPPKMLTAPSVWRNRSDNRSNAAGSGPATILSSPGDVPREAAERGDGKVQSTRYSECANQSQDGSGPAIACRGWKAPPPVWRPGGTPDNSPAIHRWVTLFSTAPAGTLTKATRVPFFHNFSAPSADSSHLFIDPPGSG